MEQIFSSVYNEFCVLLDQRLDLNSLMLSTSRLLKSEISHYDWVGFYLLDAQNNQLVLGPYAGAATDHTHIPVGKGICGQVAASKQTKVVQDVAEQDNYLACSMDVQSEIVVPILKDGRFIAEIDIDSHAYAPFTTDDEQFLLAIAEKLAQLF
ncbi:MAG: GAF domain-containing protein [Prolixibacteraceae bacterium]|jgi:GAF domain-containing protein|nr:GAF domain-containing protein [Prolixibacteraceae bacterium]